MTSPAPKHTISSPQSKRRSSGWSEERRTAHAEAMRRWKPWEKSTGPRTQKGKAIAAKNARKALTVEDAMDKLTQDTLRAQARYLAELEKFSTLQKISPQNGLLKRKIRDRRRALLRKGKKITKLMLRIYVYHCLERALQVDPAKPAMRWSGSFQ